MEIETQKCLTHEWAVSLLDMSAYFNWERSINYH